MSWGSCSALFTADSVIILVRTVLSYHIVVLSEPFPLCLCFLAGLFFPYWQFVKICINLEFKACIMVSLCCVCLKLINDRTSLGVVLWRVVSQVLHVNERRRTHSARWLAQPLPARRADKPPLCFSAAYSAYLSKDCINQLNMSAESVFSQSWGGSPIEVLLPESFPREAGRLSAASPAKASRGSGAWCPRCGAAPWCPELRHLACHLPTPKPPHSSPQTAWAVKTIS